jgi:dynein heavy chain
MDARHRWVQERVLSVLRIEKDKWDELFARDEKNHLTELTNFFNTAAQDSTVFFNVQQISEKEIREVPVEVDPAADPGEAGAEASGDPAAEGASEGERGGSKEAASEGGTTSTRKEEVIVTKNVLCLTVGHLEEGSGNKSCVYFVKLNQGPIDVTGKNPHDEMINCLNFGSIEGTFLKDLELMMREIYMPVLSMAQDDGGAERSGSGDDPAEQGEEGEAAGEPAAPAATEEVEEGEPAGEAKEGAAGGDSEQHAVELASHILEEVLASASKFTTQVHQTVMQVYGNVNIRIPYIDQLDDLAAAQHDTVLLQTLEQSVEDWLKIIDGVLRDEAQRKRESKYPMAEIDYWRDRSSKVSTLYEQLQLPAVQKVLGLLQASDPPILLQYQDQFVELQKMHVESKDNVKFLTTLERHFKNLASGSMHTIVETLPSLLNAMRMVWIISRYFNTDEYMEPLMKRIADQIADKVEEQISVNHIFSLEPAKAMSIILQGKEALDKWNTTYLATREKIEESGTDHRWEFDRPKLFKKTNYMSKICENLYDIAQVLDQFYKFLGPELKEVTGDSQGIDDLLREVAQLTSDFKTFPSLFEDRFQNTWDNLVAKFKDRVEHIENKAIAFLNKSFQNLRSAEGAFKLLQNFKNIESREKINKKMNEKFVDILTQYGNEVRRMRSLFRKGKVTPPISKNTPPTAGGILWARSIFYRVKRPVLSFKTMPHLLQLSEGQQACKDYVELGHEILEYEQFLFEAWQATAKEVAEQCLKNNILGKRKGKYFVKFAPDLQLLIREAKYLDQVGGFELPHTVLNVALQQDKYKEFVEQLNLLLDAYDGAVGDLTAVQRKLLHKQVVELDKCLRPGLTPLNWNSLGILDFIEDGNRGISAFRSVRDQVQKSEERIETVVSAIENASLVRPFDWKRPDVMDHMEFYEYFEKHRVAQVEDLVKKYDSIGPFLVKIEETTAGTKTGSAPSMVEYYQYWERRIFNAITTMLLKGMSSFQTLFGGGDKRRPPLLKIKADFNGSEVVDNGLQSVFRLISKLLQNTIHSANHFIRWMEGTCRLVPPQPSQEEDQKQLFTFYRDVKENPALIDMTINIQNSIQKVFQVIHKFLRSWRRYESQWGLWDPKRKQDLDKVAEKKPNVYYFDVYIFVYKGLADGLASYPSEKDISFVRIDSTSVIAGIRAQAMEWVASYGDILRKLAQKELTKIQAEIEAYHEQLAENPESLEELKTILGFISQICSVSMDMEIRINDVKERYRTLELYNCACDPEEHADANGLLDSWQALKDVGLTKDRRLVRVKEQFAEVTRLQVAEFAEQCKELSKEFKHGGPGSPSITLEDGVELMKKYDVDMKTFQKKREELVKAQTLFNLPVQPYPELTQLEKDLKLLRMIYEVYTGHSALVHDFSSMLWSKLDIAALGKGAEDFDKKVRRMPKECKELGELQTFHKLEELISSFKTSVPLIQSLKHDAIRPQHWVELLALAGQESGELDPKKMSLSTVFSLELNRFPEEVNEIVVTAQNELKIESEVGKIDAAWRNMSFQMMSYKGERGFVLLPNEEMRQTLEDHVLVLQSMGASKYALKLLDTIKKWEKNLTTVSEVFDAWLQVQRKWQYL